MKIHSMPNQFNMIEEFPKHTYEKAHPETLTQTCCSINMRSVDCISYSLSLSGSNNPLWILDVQSHHPTTKQIHGYTTSPMMQFLINVCLHMKWPVIKTNGSLLTCFQSFKQTFQIYWINLSLVFVHMKPMGFSDWSMQNDIKLKEHFKVKGFCIMNMIWYSLNLNSFGKFSRRDKTDHVRQVCPMYRVLSPWLWPTSYSSACTLNILIQSHWQKRKAHPLIWSLTC